MNIDYKKQGKRNRRKGLDFERKVREDLQESGWIVSKWQNNVNLKNNKCIPAKHGKFKMMQTGFPDFIAYKQVGKFYKIIFVEVKMRGYLSKEEKEKVKWYLEKGYCNEFMIAKKVKEKDERGKWRVYVDYGIGMA